MVPEELLKTRQVFVETEGLPEDNNHDPSNIVYANGKYHLWVTQHRNDRPFEHFFDTKIMRTSSHDGIHWSPLTDALLPSEAGFDAGGVLTANVMLMDGRYYMIYTGVDKEFGTSNHFRYVGLAAADNPEGVFERVTQSPIIGPSGSGWDYDSADDVTILKISDVYRLYYKGHPAGAESDCTLVGMAESKSLLGPYERYKGNPLIKGHAFAIWPYQHGYLYLSGLKDTDEGRIYGGDWNDPKGTQSLYWSEDGIAFTPVIPCQNRAAGIFPGDGKDINTCWGVVVKTRDRHLKRYIARFDFVTGE